jgi:hypothetical protein
VRYLWRDSSFEIPDGLADRSVVLLVDEREETPPFSLSLAHDALDSGDTAALTRYVDEVIRESTARLASLRILARTADALDGNDLVRVTQDASPEPGQLARQHQAFVRDGAGVTILTVTTDPDGSARALDALDALLRSMKRVAS